RERYHHAHQVGNMTANALSNRSRMIRFRGVVGLSALLLGSLVALSCTNEIAGLGPPSNPSNETFASSLGISLAAMKKTASGLYYLDVTIGTGAKITKDTSLTLTYAGYLKDGTVFDAGSSAQIDMKGSVDGFREGVTGMAVGGRRKLVIPSELGYGA